MSQCLRVVVGLLGVQAFILLLPEVAHAYGGPGTIISGIGALIGVVAAVGATLFGFVWFPLKRLIQKVRGGERNEEEPEVAGTAGDFPAG